jgi:hypothetical protein
MILRADDAAKQQSERQDSASKAPVAASNGLSRVVGSQRSGDCLKAVSFVALSNRKSLQLFLKAL